MQKRPSFPHLITQRPWLFPPSVDRRKCLTWDDLVSDSASSAQSRLHYPLPPPPFWNEVTLFNIFSNEMEIRLRLFLIYGSSTLFRLSRKLPGPPPFFLFLKRFSFRHLLQNTLDVGGVALPPQKIFGGYFSQPGGNESSSFSSPRVNLPSGLYCAGRSSIHSPPSSLNNSIASSSFSSR